VKNLAAAGETVARLVNLAQAGQSRLSETDRGSPRLDFASGRLGDPLLVFEQASISPRREGTRLSETPRWLLVPPSSPRLSEGVPPERDPSV